MNNLKVLNTDELLEKLEKRNLKIENKEKAKKILENITYFKLKEFSYTYLENGKKFKDGISFEMLLNHFYIDKKLRFLSLSLIEIIEIALKTRLIKILGKEDPYSYINFEFAKRNDKGKTKNLQSQFLKKSDKIIKEEYEYGLKIFKNFILKKNKYKIVPIWILMEILSLGQIVEVLNILNDDNLEIFLKDFKVEKIQFLQEMKVIKKLRNMSAHNNDVLGHKFEIFNDEKSVFHIILIIVKYIENIGMKYNFKEVENLFSEVYQKTNFITQDEKEMFLIK